MRLLKISRFLLPLAFLAGCGTPTTPAPMPDFSVALPPPDMAPAGCTDDKTCKDPTAHCDVKTGKCVGCTSDDHCPLGQVCSAGACAAGCNMAHSCGDAGVCDNDAGVCRSCMMDGDCGDPANPRCDVANRKCVPCLPDKDNCQLGKYCANTAGVYACAAGCARDADCMGDGGAPSAACCNHVCTDTATDNNNCKMCGSVCAMGKTCCGQACVDTTSDSNNCGACGTICMLPGMASPACTNSKCAIAKCADGTADCDNDPKNGCEININTDPKNCLGCANTCVAAHAVSGCNMGCTVAMCNNGYADCDKSFANGCEVDLTSTVTDCSACGMACGKVPNGLPGCAMSACTVASCDGAFADCNMVVNDGCEVDTSNDPKNCGACAKACPAPAHGLPGCVAGVCGVGSCTAPFKDCNMNGNDGCEVDTSIDTANCGACGKACAGIPNGVVGCVASACVVASCTAGFKDCNANLNDGCEVNTNTDIKNCGGCGKVCPDVPNGSPICTNGVCGATGCVLPFKDCDGNAGNGCEVNTNTDAKNCGLCGTVCANVVNGTAGCAAGKCGIGVCNMGFKDCNNMANDGCEVNTASDPNNCNGCGVKCALANATSGCANSACTVAACAGGFGDCDKNPVNGCELNILVDINNCGGCGIVCPGVANGTSACINGKCGVGSCTAPFKDCNGIPGDGCEANTTNDAKNCAACGVVCANGCVNSVCAVYHWVELETQACNAWCTGGPFGGCTGSWTCDANHVNGIIWLYSQPGSPPPAVINVSGYGWVAWYCGVHGCGGPGPNQGNCNTNGGASIWQCKAN